MERALLGVNPELRTPRLLAAHVRAGTDRWALARSYTTITSILQSVHSLASCDIASHSPAEPVRDVIYPVMGGEAGLTELVGEYRARRAHERDKRRVFKSSYTNHYRTGLIKLLQVLEFRSNNTEHQPVCWTTP